MVNLQKGSTVNLVKEAPGLDRIEIGLGWDPSVTTGVDFDLDAIAYLLGADGKVVSDEHFVFYNNLTSPDGAVVGANDDRTGDSSDGDDEVITVNLSQVSSAVQQIVICVDIHDGNERGQNFGQVNDAFVRIVDTKNSEEIVKYDLTGDYSKSDAVIFGALKRVGAEWEFSAIGEGRTGGIIALCREFGVAV
jgi:tellurium resistance protein TerD